MRIPEGQLVAVFLFAFIFFYSAIMYGMTKAKFLGDDNGLSREGKIMCIAISGFMTLSLVYSLRFSTPRKLVEQIFQGWLGTLAPIVLGLVVFVFVFKSLRTLYVGE